MHIDPKSETKATPAPGCISPDMTSAFHVKQSAEQTLSSAKRYRGKYPTRIKTLACDRRKEGERFGAIRIETNNGARFVYRLLHRDAPMPVIGQDVADWLLHIEPTNDQGRAACALQTFNQE